jgi:hypothetical protein
MGPKSLRQYDTLLMLSLNYSAEDEGCRCSHEPATEQQRPDVEYLVPEGRRNTRV